MVKNLPWSAGDTGSISGWGTKIPHASWRKNQNNVVTNSIKTLKMLQISKKKKKKKLNKKEVVVIIANTV